MRLWTYDHDFGFVKDAATHKLVCQTWGLDEEDFDDAKRNGQILAAAPEMLETIKEQHKALDWLLAVAIEHVPGFLPTKSLAWPAVVKGHEIVKKLEGS